MDVFVNDGLIQGRGNADADLGTAGDGFRVEPQRVDGVLDGTTAANFGATFLNRGVIDSEGDNGDVAGFRVADGVDFDVSFSNEGTISGTRNGVFIGDGVHRGSLINSGTISSDSRALSIDGQGTTNTGIDFRGDPFSIDLELNVLNDWRDYRNR